MCFTTIFIILILFLSVRLFQYTSNQMKLLQRRVDEMSKQAPENIYWHTYSRKSPINSLTINSLPDEIILNIFRYLNQIHVCHICIINSRFYRLGKIRLYHSIYVNLSNAIEISSATYTPFYTTFTIVNKWDSTKWSPENSNINLVKRILFRESYSCFYDVPRLFPWIDVSYEEEFRTNAICNRVRLMYNGHLVLPFYSKGLSSFDKWIKVKKLTIYMNSSHRTNLDVILCFPNLIDLAIEFDHSSQLNRFLYIRLGRIQHLRLAFFNPVTLDLIKQIEDIFNLQELITFQLHLWNEEAYPRLLENSLQNLISTLSSVQNLSLICKPVQFGNIIKNLKPNSLTSFYVRIVGIMDKPLAIETILINQHQSIKQLFYCYVSPSSPSKRVYGIEEFDKVFKVKSNTYLDDLLDGLNEIKTILYHAGRFPNLDQVFYNDYCYFIERISDKIYISPSNNVISTCCIRPY